MALMCAKNSIIIFCTLLDIQENVVASFFGPPCIFVRLIKIFDKLDKRSHEKIVYICVHVLRF